MKNTTSFESKMRRCLMILATVAGIVFFGQATFLLWAKNQVYLSGKTFNVGYVSLPEGEPLFFWLYNFLHLIMAVTAIFVSWTIASTASRKFLISIFVLVSLLLFFYAIGAGEAFFFLCFGSWLLYEAKVAFKSGLLGLKFGVIDRRSQPIFFWIIWVWYLFLGAAGIVIGSLALVVFWASKFA